ncbi:uncharacterized protein TNCV_2707281 [Trichonephila clavipes]|nr:uncharacterized protein TNCV_2707281 [Trichonephila clavipes]
MACERKFLESEATTGFFLLLGKQGNKAVLDWVMKEGLIPSRYECLKCKKDMRLVERKGTIDGFEWHCRVQSKENPHFVCRSIPDVSEPVQIPVSQVPQPPVQIPDVPEPVQIPVSHVPQPPVQIPHVPEPPVQIPQVPQSPVQIPFVPESPVPIPDVPEPVQIPVSQVPQPPVQILHVPEPMQILHVPEPMQILHVPEPMQILPQLDTLEPMDAFDQLMSFVFGPPAQELQLLHTVPFIFDGDLISFLDEFEKAPMNLTMPRLNSCVKKSIGFKAIQPMDLSVNICL